jgi:SAM-dependent methyltransferase
MDRIASVTSQRAARFWNENRGLAEEPTFWMAHPVCRAAINRRVTGSAEEWPLDWFKRRYGAQPRSRGLSWGSGLGGFERWAIRLGIVSAIDAFDLSPVSIREAEQAAAAEGIRSITYKLGDFNRPFLEEATYDIVFFHASLHHVANLEGLFSAISRALRPGGAIYVDD